jgi:hypothetical protein
VRNSWTLVLIAIWSSADPNNPYSSTYEEGNETPSILPTLVTMGHKPMVQRNTCMHCLVCSAERFVCVDVHTGKYRDS